MIRVFIGTDIHNVKAERVLIYSILRQTTADIEFHLMDRTRNRGPEWQDWQKTSQWATGFSCFRWAIPAVSGYEGRSIYLDSDQLVLGDIRELAEIDLEGKAFGTTEKRCSSVSVFDCSKFEGWELFGLQDLKESAAKTNEYYDWLRDRGEVSFFSQRWNDLDCYEPGQTKLIHYTKLTTQPWNPAPHKFSYKKHDDERAALLWHRYYEKSYSEPLDAEVRIANRYKDIL